MALLTQAALEELMEAGWLREIRPPAPDKQGGRPAGPVYRIHPAAREILKEQGEANEGP